MRAKSFEFGPIERVKRSAEEFVETRARQGRWLSRSINTLSMRGGVRKVDWERLVFDGVESKRYSLGFEFLVGTCDRCVRATF